MRLSNITFFCFLRLFSFGFLVILCWLLALLQFLLLLLPLGPWLLSLLTYFQPITALAAAPLDQQTKGKSQEESLLSSHKLMRKSPFSENHFLNATNPTLQQIFLSLLTEPSHQSFEPTTTVCEALLFRCC